MSEIIVNTQSPCIVCGLRKAEIKGAYMQDHLTHFHQMDAFREAKTKLLKVSFEEYEKAKRRAIDRIIVWDFEPDDHCPVCANSYTSIKNVIQHMNRAHFDYYITVFPKVCKECGEKFTRTDDMKRHYAKHFQTEKLWSDPEPFQAVRNPDAMLNADDEEIEDMYQAMSGLSIVFSRR
jgi:hypothetical protein